MKRLLDFSARQIKSALGWMMFQTGMYRRMLRGQAVIVLFHRISDQYPGDPITCSRDSFERFVDFFGKYFKVITLSELLLVLPSGTELEGKLVITFDDGYLDNATVAAPILERKGIRGTFFLTTDYLGTDRIPPWDQQRGNVSQWMSWDQARRLRAAGHDVGSHTQNHPDLGKIRGEDARREIGGGAERLNRELGEATGLFARPFGWHGQMAAENTQIVKELGLRCDLSAYGGTIAAGDDPYHLKRTPISGWFHSPYQFGFELVTGKVNTTDPTTTDPVVT